MPWRVGVLTAGTWPQETVQEFRQALAEAGYSDGRNVVLEWKPASSHFDRLPQLADDLVSSPRVTKRHLNDSHSHGLRIGSSRGRPCSKPNPSRWKYHRPVDDDHRA